MRDLISNAVVYWFRLKRTQNGIRFQPHLIDNNSVGLQIAATDVNGDGHLDVLTASKLGTFLFVAQHRHAQRVEQGQ